MDDSSSMSRVCVLLGVLQLELLRVQSCRLYRNCRCIQEYNGELSLAPS